MHCFMGKEGDRFEMVRGWAGIKNGGWGKVVMIKILIICVTLSVLLMEDFC